MKKTWMRGISGFLTLSMCLSLLTCGASAAGYNVEISGENTVAVGGTTTLTAATQEIGQIGSWSGGGTDASTTGGDDYAYDPALYVTAEGMQKQLSATDRITEGTYDEKGATGVVIDDSDSGHNGILINNTAYTIKNATITMDTDADGTDTCDFSGKGTAIMAVGSDANVTIENSTITTAGVATMPIFSDNGATVTIKNSTLDSQGGTLYKEYMNSPDQAVMVAPPWILGIMGTSRCTNLEGTDSTMNVIDSTTSAANWAVLSTDSGSNMYLNMYNTSLTLTNWKEDSSSMQAEGGQLGTTLDDPYTTNYGAGYGTYAIGNAVETFAGTTVNAGTYATIFTGGSATFTNIVKGRTYTLKSADGEHDVTYKATATKNSVVNSDTFGFMFHQSANTLAIKNRTVINSELATFLIKSGSSNETADITVDNSTLNNGGVLLQIMDNDDATNGGMLSADDEYNTNKGNMNFIPYHTEKEGWNTAENTAESEQSLTLTNGEYEGNIYNASGTDNSKNGPLKGTILNLTLGKGAELDGAVASTAAIHVTYEGTQALKERNFAAFESEEEAKAAGFVEKYQNTYFWMNQYYDIGQVANLICDNGGNGINVTMTDNAVWNVTTTSVIDSLSISGSAKVVVPAGVTLTVGDKEYTGCTITKEAISPAGDNVFVEQIGSYSGGGKDATDNDYLYNAALYVDETGIVADRSNLNRIKGEVSATEAKDVTIEDAASGHNGIIVNNAAYTIDNVTIKMDTKADGTDTNDFSGKGTAVMATGSKADLTIKNSNIETTGVANLTVFGDKGSTVTIENSTLKSNGGTIYKDYLNTAIQSIMVSPPWILGIMGTSRITNLEGENSTMNVLDSDTSAGAWAGLSTDSGSNMVLNVYGTTITLNNKDEGASTPIQAEGGQIKTQDNPYTTNYGSGYGTYTIGNAAETFAGATINAGTYANIFTGGSATYTSLEKDKVYDLANASGLKKTYTAKEDAVTTINSDTFGIMTHQGSNTLVMEKGTVVNSGYTAFLMKSGSSNASMNATISDTEINAGNGVLIQVMDNDDATNPAPTMGNGGPIFADYHEEAAGWNTTAAEGSDGSSESAAGPGYVANDGTASMDFTFINETLTGNMYNAGGSDKLTAVPLNITLEKSTLSGAISSTSAIHVTKAGSDVVKENKGVAFEKDSEAATTFEKTYHNTYFTASEYYDIGQVANMINYNGQNNVNVVVKSGSTWTVTSTSIVTTLIVEEGAKVVVNEGVNLTVIAADKTFTGETLTNVKYEVVNPYADLVNSTEENSWYFDSVYAIRDKGWMIGDDANNFRPESTLTREEAAVIAVRVAGLEVDKDATESGFDDVTGWSVPYVAAAEAAGIINGYGDGKFGPTDNVTREQFAKMLLIAMGVDVNSDEYASAKTTFKDVDLNQWYAPYVAVAQKLGIVKGYDEAGTTFGVGKNITRAEAAVMLSRVPSSDNGGGGMMPPGGPGGGDSGETGDTALVIGTVVEPKASEGGEGGGMGPGGPGGGPGGPGGGEGGTTPSAKYEYTWTFDTEGTTVPATLKNNEDGTATVTGVAEGTVKVTVTVIKNGVQIGSDTIEITVSAGSEEVVTPPEGGTEAGSTEAGTTETDTGETVTE